MALQQIILMKPVFPVIIFFLFLVLAEHSFAYFQIVNFKSVLWNNGINQDVSLV